MASQATDLLAALPGPVARGAYGHGDLLLVHIDGRDPLTHAFPTMEAASKMRSPASGSTARCGPVQVNLWVEWDVQP